MKPHAIYTKYQIPNAYIFKNTIKYHEILKE